MLVMFFGEGLFSEGIFHPKAKRKFGFDILKFSHHYQKISD
jgi:hypothetical protein